MALLRSGRGAREAVALQRCYQLTRQSKRHPTRTERFRESAIERIDFAPPLIRVWSLDSYNGEAVEHLETHGLGAAGGGLDVSRSASPAKAPPVPGSATFNPHKPDYDSEIRLVEMSSQTVQRDGQLPTRGAELRLVPEPNDWERYKDIIAELYMRRNMNLAQVRIEMEKRYGIKAT